MPRASLQATEVLAIRPIAPDDKDALREGYERLGERSRYRRFLAPHGRLTDEELRYFTDVDHHDHEALVAFDAETDEGVGVARFVRSADDPDEAELAVAVIDEWQGRGVGTRLVAALADRAREEGIKRFSGLVLADNELMLSVLRELGEVRVLHEELGTVELTVELPERGLGRLGRLLRALALNQILPFGLGRPDGSSDPPSAGRP